jgi:hypothetical protein
MPQAGAGGGDVGIGGGGGSRGSGVHADDRTEIGARLQDPAEMGLVVAGDVVLRHGKLPSATDDVG